MRYLEAAVGILLGAFAGALLLTVVFTGLGLLYGGFAGVIVAMTGGPVLGGAAGAAAGYRAARRLDVEREPPPRAHPAWAWGFALALVASPFALLAVGPLPPFLWWRFAGTAMLGAAASVAFVRCRAHAPLLLFFLWPIAFVVAWDLNFPKWRCLNEPWCGHMCDSPCS
jgi:hypothetical protein